MDWDDLRYVLEVSRTGSTLAAAKSLGVNQTTVARRVAALEERLGAKLFERRQAGYEPTPLGLEAAEAAERMEREAQTLANRAASQQRTLEGSVRISTAETIANLIVAPCLQAFYKVHPGVRVELHASDRRVDVGKGEADVALRAGSRPEGTGIVARRLSDNDWTVYCSRAYAVDHGAPNTPEDITTHPIVALDGPLERALQGKWLEAHTKPENLRIRSNSLTNLVSYLRAGLGVGALPCVLGDSEPELVRCFDPLPELRSEMWLIVRAELKAIPHVRAFADFLAAYVNSQRPKLAPTLA